MAGIANRMTIVGCYRAHGVMLQVMTVHCMHSTWYKIRVTGISTSQKAEQACEAQDRHQSCPIATCLACTFNRLEQKILH